MNSFVSWISHQEDFLFTEISMSFLLMLTWYFVIFFGIRFFVKKTSKSLIFMLFSIVFVQFLCFFEDFQKNKTKEFIVFHKSRKAILGERKGTKLVLHSDVDSITLQQEKLIASYRIGEKYST